MLIRSTLLHLSVIDFGFNPKDKDSELLLEGVVYSFWFLVLSRDECDVALDGDAA